METSKAVISRVFEDQNFYTSFKLLMDVLTDFLQIKPKSLMLLIRK